MIIWLNGAFGAGKTQTAFELHSRIPDSYVFDPEYYEQTVGALRETGVQVHHLTLLASRQTILRRLRRRGDRRNSWGARQLDRCLMS
jgi:chloramphenicol 3-O-phosphotransferase